MLPDLVTARDLRCDGLLADVVDGYDPEDVFETEQSRPGDRSFLTNDRHLPRGVSVKKFPYRYEPRG
ncbi:hypothetical protein BRC88_12755 [Halobacteriales archaeon QS_4_69_225]|nr:MAG: hypothetical protein BRC88_12755 [Halobacteriales archaeon QS_4_69_225]